MRRLARHAGDTNVERERHLGVRLDDLDARERVRELLGGLDGVLFVLWEGSSEKVSWERESGSEKVRVRKRGRRDEPRHREM